MNILLLKNRVSTLLALVLLFIFQTGVYAQTSVFASSISNESEVDNSANAIDSDLSLKANIRANSGLALGLGAYSGHLELEYPSLLPQNTTSYVKIDTEDDLLPYLLGGSLGNLLADISGALLLGNQEFSVEAKNNDASVLLGESGNVDDFASNSIRVVVNNSNDHFLAITPNEAYNRIRFTNRIGSLIGLGNTKRLGVYGSFYTSGSSTCGLPLYTSFSGNGLTLDLLNIGGAGVTNPHLALDGDSSTFSELSLGIIGVAADIEQTLYFDSLSETDDSFYVTMAINPSLLQVGIADNIQIIGHNGTQETFSSTLSSLLELDVLGLLQSGDKATFGINPNVNVDRITVRLSSLLNVALVQELQLFGAYKAAAAPTIDAESSTTSICSGSMADLVAETQSTGAELRWYDAASGGNLLATLNSGDVFTTPVLNADTTFYVAAADVGCPEESPRTPVEVSVADIPTANDIDVVGNELPICSSSEVVLHPSSNIDGTFTWYFDANKTAPITDGQVVGSATYNIDSNTGALTINGLDELNSPYTFYVGLTEETAGCENVAGDLKSTEVIIVDASSNVSVDLDSVITIENLISIFGGSTSSEITGSVSGDANVGDTVTAIVNGNTYNGVLDANLEFNITVDGNDLVSDLDGIIETLVGGVACTVSDEVLIELPDLIVDDLLQIFCASDAPTLADLIVESNIVFFDGLSSDVLLDLNTPLVDGQVYFAGVLNVPVSILSRVEITVDLTDVAPPTTITVDQTFCATDNPTIADIQVDGTGVVFYDSLVAGLLLDVSTPLVDGGTYFAASVELGCESTVRLVINVDVIDPAPPTSNSDEQTFCEAEQPTVADIQINEPSVVFYDSATGGNMLDPSTPLVDGNYYAANVESGCESTTRLLITVDVIEDEPATINGETTEACLDRPYTYTTESDKQNYVWTINGGLITEGGTSTDNFVTVTWDNLQNASINVAYENEAGCSSAIDQDITTISCGEVMGEEFQLIVYNEFTPNSDGYNDFFEIEGILEYSSTVKIYNRNGNLVYEANNYQNNWDGVASVSGVLKPGEKLPSGTYYYVINIPELERNLVGWLQLAR